MMVIHIGSLQAIIKEINHHLHKFDLESHIWPWAKGHRSKLTSQVDSFTMISYMMVIHILHKFELDSHIWPWTKGHRSKLSSPVDSLTMISYMMVIHADSLQAIIKETSTRAVLYSPLSVIIIRGVTIFRDSCNERYQ